MIETWHDFIVEEKKKDYYKELAAFLKSEYSTKTIYPAKEEVFKAFKYTPLHEVRVVILGQDPYQTPSFANGLAFSVNPNIMLPKSLQNIYKELFSDLGITKTGGDLTSWAKNGILLLNTILTVEKGISLSHQHKGWETFTDNALKLLNSLNQPIVFILWGNRAKEKRMFLNNPNHLIITSAHPSPLSAYNGFFGSRPFSRACSFLNAKADIWR